jgi:transposase
VSIVKEADAYPILDLLEDAASESFKGSTVFHSDETGVSVRGENHWVHVIVNGLFTRFFAHKKRGMEEMEYIGILTEFSEALTHDCRIPYFNLPKCKHAVCGARLLREFGVGSAGLRVNHKRAGDVKELLLGLSLLTRLQNVVLSPQRQALAREEYEAIIARGLEETGGAV